MNKERIHKYKKKIYGELLKKLKRSARAENKVNKL